MNFDPINLTELFRFIRWGDDVLLEAARAVPEMDYYKDHGISAGSLHKLLLHMMTAEWIWVGRFKRQPPHGPNFVEEFPTIESLIIQWPKIHDEVEQFLAMQTIESLNENFSYHDSRGTRHELPLGHFIQHMIDHGTYHRGQANTLLKRCGGRTANVMYYHYRERHHSAATLKT